MRMRKFMYWYEYYLPTTSQIFQHDVDHEGQSTLVSTIALALYDHHRKTMKSFLKSLPSHRKKEKGKRKSRHHKSRDNEEGGGGGGERGVTIGFLDQTGELNLDYRRGQIRNAMLSTS